MTRFTFHRGFDRRSFLLGGASLAGMLALLPVEAFGQTARKGVLKYATLGLDTSDPHRHTGSIAVQQCYVETLTSIAADGSVEPFLADSFDVSPDGLNYLFKLRPNVKFHNGDVMTAADVAANFEGSVANWEQRCKSQSRLSITRRGFRTARKAWVSDCRHTSPVVFASCEPSRCRPGLSPRRRLT